MKHNVLAGVRSLILALGLLVFALPALTAGAAFSKIVVFGDSLNDRGNMVQFTGGVFPNAPAYAFGRQSNGQVWVEYLANRLGLADKLVNYAVVGALLEPTVANPTGNVWDDTFPGLQGTDVTSQVSDYLRDANGVADAAALFVLEGGANDFPRVADPSAIVFNLVRCLVALERSGAKHILLVNLPDIGKTPRVILGEQMGLLPPGTASFLSVVCGQLNGALAAAAGGATLPDVTISIADMYGFLGTVTGNPSAYGFTVVQLPYLITGANVGADPSPWLFWDDLHPTTRGHELFAEFAFAAMVENYTPRNANPSAQGLFNSLRGHVKNPPQR